MIIFLGDSFTWGQGLEWEYAITEKGWSIEKINTLIPPKHASERLPIEMSDFRQKNHWPRLVSEHFNHQYDLSRCGNGGGNGDSAIFLENIQHFIHLENLDLIIFQFTMAGRNMPKNFNGTIEDLFMGDVILFENCMNKIKSKVGTENKTIIPNVKFLTVSWLPEISNIIENRLGSEMVVKFNFNGIEYNSFEPFVMNISLDSKYNGLRDSHFNLEGHQFIAKSVIEHIEKHNIINNSNNNQI